MSERTQFQRGHTQETIPDLPEEDVTRILNQQALLGVTNEEQRQRAIQLAVQRTVNIWPFLLLLGGVIGFVLYYLLTQGG